MDEQYTFDARDRNLLTAAVALLKKVAVAETLEPARLVSIAKLQHLFSRLPRTAPDMEVSVSIVGPRQKFDDIETWHYWDVAVEQKRLSISSGGHYYHPSSGGDSFTSMTWVAIPEQPTTLEDYRETLWMVPDVQSFPEGVAGIDFASGEYRIEVADSDNLLLTDEDREDPQGDNVLAGNPSAEMLPRPDLVTAAMSTQGGQIPLEEDSTFRLGPSIGDYLLWIKCRNPLCSPPEFAIADFWEFREGDQLLITNRERDYPATIEQMEEGGPNLWKAVPGDRLAWVGWRTGKPTLVALFNCLREGFVYGEPASPTLESVIGFGAPTGEATPEVRSLWMVGYHAAVALGIPDVWQPPEIG